MTELMMMQEELKMYPLGIYGMNIAASAVYRQTSPGLKQLRHMNRMFFLKEREEENDEIFRCRICTGIYPSGQ